MSFDHFNSTKPRQFDESSNFDNDSFDNDSISFDNDSISFDRFSNRDEDSQLRMAKARKAGAFDSKAAIFDYLFFTEGLPLEEAEQQAIKIAAIRGVPDITAKPKTGIESTIEKIEVAFNVAEKYPWAKDLLISVASAAIGAGAGFFAGKEESKIEQKPSQPNIYQQLNQQTNNSKYNGTEPSETI